jgi:hypothetical protein
LNHKLSKLFTWRDALISEYGPGPTTRHVLLTLSLHMDKDGGSCFPSTKKTARETGLSERTVCTHLEIAKAQGWIEKNGRVYTGRNWKRHFYQALIPPDALKEVQHQGTETDSAPLEKGTEPHAEGTEPDDKKALKEVQSSTSYNSSKNSSNKYTSDSIEIGLSKSLLNLILQRNQKFKKPNLQAWAKHIDRAIRLDNRTPQELEAVIEWCQADTFWQNNILSTGKLRKQFDRLYLQMKGNGDGTNRGSNKPGFKDGGAAGQKSKKYSRIGTSLSAEG